MPSPVVILPFSLKGLLPWLQIGDRGPLDTDPLVGTSKSIGYDTVERVLRQREANAISFCGALRIPVSRASANFRQMSVENPTSCEHQSLLQNFTLVSNCRGSWSSRSVCSSRSSSATRFSSGCRTTSLIQVRGQFLTSKPPMLPPLVN